MNIFFTFIFLIIPSILFSKSHCENELLSKSNVSRKMILENADLFSYNEVLNIGFLKIQDQEYILYKNIKLLKKIPKSCLGIPSVKIPIEKLSSLSTTHLPFLYKLNVIDKLKGFSGAKYIYNKSILKMIDEKKMIDLSTPYKIESLLETKSKVFLVDNLNSIYNCNKLKKFGVVCLGLFEYLEKSALGRSEWIKLYGVLFSKSSEALNIFNSIKKNYIETRKASLKQSVRVKVLVGNLGVGSFKVPPSHSYLVQLLNDVGVEMPFSREKTAVSLEELKLGLKNYEINYWLPQSNSKTVKELFSTNKKYRLFPKLKSMKIFNNSKKISKMGGNDYYESAVLRPDLVLRDLYLIFYGDEKDQTNLNWFIKI